MPFTIPYHSKILEPVGSTVIAGGEKTQEPGNGNAGQPSLELGPGQGAQEKHGVSLRATRQPVCPDAGDNAVYTSALQLTQGI